MTEKLLIQTAMLQSIDKNLHILQRLHVHDIIVLTIFFSSKNAFHIVKEMRKKRKNENSNQQQIKEEKNNNKTKYTGKISGLIPR